MSMREVFWAAIIAFLIIVIIFFVGFFVYQSEQFEATVVDIEYVGRGGITGSTAVVVELDDGSVYKLWEIPKGLKKGGTYLLEYREPYILGDGYLVIVAEP